MKLDPAEWSPLLSGELRLRACAAIDDIAVALRHPLRRAALGAADREPSPLASGTAGAALFYAYKSASDHSTVDADLATELMTASIDAVAEVRMPPSLYQGFCGVAWAQAHLTRHLFEGDESGAGDEINAALTDYVRATQASDDFDLISGLVGFGVYALEQAADPANDPTLAAILTAIDSLAERALIGRAWRTPPSRLDEATAARHPQGVFDLGVAHGVGGVIGLLSAASTSGVRSADSLLDEAVQWLRGQTIDDPGISVFPAQISEGHAPGRTRLAWCYGDAGLAVVLLAAARALGRGDLEDYARQIARLAAARPEPSTSVRDSGLCHGAAGLGHLFNRLYQATGESSFGHAARRWFAWLLADRRPDAGVAGWSAVSYSDGGERREPEAGFLIGAAGIGLALLAATSPIEPAWDRVLLAAIPERRV